MLRTPEEQYISVSVPDFKSPQPIIVVLEWLKKLNITRRKLCRQRIRIRDIKVSVPAGDSFFDISFVIGYGINTNVLQHDHRPAPLNNGEEDVVVTRPLKRDVEPETVAIKRQRYGNILYDEEWRNAENFCFSHGRFDSKQ